MKNFDLKKYAMIFIPFAIGFVGAFVLAGAVDIIPLPRIVTGLIGGGIFSLVVHEKMKDAKKWKHNEEYGSARWGA